MISSKNDLQDNSILSMMLNNVEVTNDSSNNSLSDDLNEYIFENNLNGNLDNQDI